MSQNVDFAKDGKIDDQQWGVKSTGNHDSAHSSNVIRNNGLHLNFAKKQSASFQYSGAHVQSRFQNLGWFINSYAAYDMLHIKCRLAKTFEWCGIQTVDAASVVLTVYLKSS